MWFRLAARSTICFGRPENPTIGFDFIRNTSTLKVAVTGLEHLPVTRATTTTPLRIHALGKNEHHKWDNKIDWWARVVRYDSRNVALTPGTMSVDIQLMRLDLERHTGDGGDPVMLCLQDSAGRDIIPPIDLLEAIGQICAPGGRQLYGTQEEIDREEEFRVAIALGPGGDGVGVGATVHINDWEIIILDPNTEFHGK